MQVSSHYRFQSPQKNRLNNEAFSREDAFFSVKRVYFFAIILLVPLLITYANSGLDAKILTIYGPLYFIAIMGWVVYAIIRNTPEMIWTAFALFPLQSAVFFGMGPLVYEFGNAETYMRIASNLIYVTTEDVIRACLLSQLGATLVMFGMLVTLKFTETHQRSIKKNKAPDFPISTVMGIFLITGIILKYFLITPSMWGMVDIPIPGSLNALTALVDLGFAVLAYLAISTNLVKWKILFWVLWPIHIILCLISLAKVSVILAILLPILGAYVANRNSLKFFVGMTFTAITYINLQPWNDYGRSLNLEERATISPENYTQGLLRLSDYVLSLSSGEVRTEDTTQSQGWWTRLNYTAEQVFVMDLYDSGTKSERLNDFWISFIPRAIWPEKPIMSGEGTRLYTLITGNDGTSSSGVTIYGDMYWHYGWLGVWIIAPLVGALFMFLSKFCLNVIKQRNFIYFPVVGICLQTFLIGATSFLVVSIIGPIPIIVVYLMLIKLGQALLKM